MDTSVRPTVLVIDDESSIRGFLSEVLGARFNVLTADSGLEGIRLAKSSAPDVILLDILMPGDDGLACLEELRRDQATKHLPILMLTALNEPDVRIRAFSSGADDFIPKPFQPDELIARIDSKLSRLKSADVVALVLRLGNVAADMANLRVSVDGQDVNISPVEFKIICQLMRQHGQLVRREDIENSVWPAHSPAERVLDSHISSLRRKLQGSTLTLQTVYGLGYTMTVKDRHE